MEENVIKKMCYIDDIKKNIKKMTYHAKLNIDKLNNVFSDAEIRNFIIQINNLAHDNDSRFTYRSITVLTKKDDIVNMAWNFKKEFPIFIIGRQKLNGEKYLDADFCMPAECPAELATYLEDWKATHVAGCTELPCSKNQD